MPETMPLWETSELRTAAGETLRPGGFALTDRGADLIGVLPGWRVLDVGAGLGATVGRLRARYGASAWGVEPSQAQIERGDSVGLIRATGDVLPFTDGVFDAVFCECVLSLFEAPAQGLEEFRRVLKPNGFLVLTDLCAGEAGASCSGSCAGRAIPLAETQAMVTESGFGVRHVEDHSCHLRDLAARLIMTGGGGHCDTGRHLGYFLMIAQKRG